MLIFLQISLSVWIESSVLFVACQFVEVQTKFLLHDQYSCKTTLHIGHFIQYTFNTGLCMGAY